MKILYISYRILASVDFVLIHSKFEEKYGRLGSTFAGNHLARTWNTGRTGDENLIENAKRVACPQLISICNRLTIF